jgi:membrane protein DedA with SNARE-associated domain
MSDYLLTQIINYGAPLFGLILFLGALGVPFPTSLLVVAAGAFSQQGFLDWFSIALFGLLGAVAGDVVSFGMGFYAKNWVSKRIEGSRAWKNARNTFESRAGMAVYLTRFLITALAVPTNWIAGGSGIKFRRFIAYDSLGELTWILLYGGLGYWFGSEWELVGDFLSNFGGLILGIVILGVGIWLGLRRRRSIENERLNGKIPEL